MKRYLYIALLSLIGFNASGGEFAFTQTRNKGGLAYDHLWTRRPQKPATTEYGRRCNNRNYANLDRLKEANFNMVFVQVRMRGDVIYKSAIRPLEYFRKIWVMPGYDPLAFVIEGCHKRNGDVTPGVTFRWE